VYTLIYYSLLLTFYYVINVVPYNGNFRGYIMWKSECLSDWNVVEGTIIPERE